MGTTVTTTGTATDARAVRCQRSPLSLPPPTPCRLHSPSIRDTTSSSSAADSTQTDSLTTSTPGPVARPRTSERPTDTPPTSVAPTPSRLLPLVTLAKRQISLSSWRLRVVSCIVTPIFMFLCLYCCTVNKCYSSYES